METPMVQPWSEYKHESLRTVWRCGPATGFLIIIYSLWNVWAGFDNVFENILQTNQGSDAEAPSSISYFVFGLPGLALGAVFFSPRHWLSGWLTGNAAVETTKHTKDNEMIVIHAPHLVK